MSARHDRLVRLAVGSQPLAGFPMAGEEAGLAGEAGAALRPDAAQQHNCQQRKRSSAVITGRHRGHAAAVSCTQSAAASSPSAAQTSITGTSGVSSRARRGRRHDDQRQQAGDPEGAGAASSHGSRGGRTGPKQLAPAAAARPGRPVQWPATPAGCSPAAVLPAWIRALPGALQSGVELLRRQPDDLAAGAVQHRAQRHCPAALPRSLMAAPSVAVMPVLPESISRPVTRRR